MKLCQFTFPTNVTNKKPYKMNRIPIWLKRVISRPRKTKHKHSWTIIGQFCYQQWSSFYCKFLLNNSELNQNFYFKLWWHLLIVVDILDYFQIKTFWRSSTMTEQEEELLNPKWKIFYSLPPYVNSLWDICCYDLIIFCNFSILWYIFLTYWRPSD